MARWDQHLAAFFDPTVAVNKEGYLVEADGFFDSGDQSSNYLNFDTLSSVREGFYGNMFGEDNEGFYSSVSSSDVVADSYGLPYADEMLSDITDAAEQQNLSAQSSADRAMEFNKEQAQLNRDWQSAQNQKAMDFSERMSNTSYQRAMADLKEAGLNPKLVGQLGGASTPSGVTSSGSAASGQAASMAMVSLGPLASVLSSYITGADALDRQSNDFVQQGFMALLSFALSYMFK